MRASFGPHDSTRCESATGVDRNSVDPSHGAEFWTSTISIAVALLAYLVFRRGRAMTQGATGDTPTLTRALGANDR